MSATSTQQLSMMTVSQQTLKTGNWYDPVGTSIDLDSAQNIAESWSYSIREPTRWHAVGNVRETFNPLLQHIEQQLTAKMDSLNRGLKFILPHRIDCYFVGSRTNPENSEPCLGISHHSYRYCRRTQREITEDEVWEQFSRSTPARIRKFRKDGYARRLGGKGVHVGKPFVPGEVFVKEDSFGCGSLIYIACLESETYRKARLGGIVWLDDKPYGLTVAHCFQTEIEDLEDFSETDSQHSSDTATDLKSSFQGECPKTEHKRLQSHHRQIQVSAISVHDDLTAAALADHNAHTSDGANPGEDDCDGDVPKPGLAGYATLGFVAFSSPGNPEDPVDWALIDISNTSILSFVSTVPLSTVSLKQNPPFASSVIKMIYPEGDVSGVMAAYPSLIGFPQASKMTWATKVQFDEFELAYGDCGAWIVDEDGILCGHVIGGVPGSPTAYISCIQEVQANIELETGKSCRFQLQNIEARSHDEKTGDTEVESIFGSGSLSVQHTPVTTLQTSQATAIAINKPDISEKLALVQKHLLQHKFFKAVKERNESDVQDFLERGFDVQQRYNGKVPLICAACTGDDAMVKLILVQGAKTDAKDDSGQTALHKAAQGNYTRVIQLLLEWGVNTEIRDKRGRTALHFCCLTEGNEDSIKLLLASGANIEARDDEGLTPRYTAVVNDNRNLALFLAHHGAFVHAKDERGEIPLSVHLGVEAAMDVRNKDERGLLHVAGRNEDIDLTQPIINKGADIGASNVKRRTALRTALLAGNGEGRNLVLEHGADIEEQNIAEHTALHFAAMTGNKMLAQALLDIGNDANEQDKKGMTALHYATARVDNNKEQTNLHDITAETKFESSLVEILLEQRADMEAKDNQGRTPLHCATYTSAHVLLARGANIDARDNNLQTVLHLAVIRRDEAFVAMLLEQNIDTETRDNEERTALHHVFDCEELNWAISDIRSSDMAKICKIIQSLEDSIKLAKLLLDHGAHINVRDKQHRTPLQYFLDRKLVTQRHQILWHNVNSICCQLLCHVHKYMEQIIQLLCDHGVENGDLDYKGFIPDFDMTSFSLSPTNGQCASSSWETCIGEACATESAARITGKKVV